MPTLGTAFTVQEVGRLEDVGVGVDHVRGSRLPGGDAGMLPDPAGLQASCSLAMKASVIAWASSSVYWRGGCFMK